MNDAVFQLNVTFQAITKSAHGSFNNHNLSAT